MATECPRCALGDHGIDLRDDGVVHTATTRVPPPAILTGWLSDSGCEATDGCWVEPDGICQHGHRSWLLQLGLI